MDDLLQYANEIFVSQIWNMKASKTSRGTKISIEWYGWLMEKELPDCEVTDSIVEKFTD